MSLIKSISGIRGTIGGVPGEALTPMDLVSFTSAFSQWLKEEDGSKSGRRYKVIVGRDARISGPMCESLVCNTLRMCGMDVVELGLATTPTVEMAVMKMNADGGIILTASHNPGNWNALKLLNAKGEFLSAQNGTRLLEIADQAELNYAEVDDIGGIKQADFLQEHIDLILELPLVNTNAISQAELKIVVDAVNSVGGTAIPALLKALGIDNVVCLNCEPNGIFAHNPEPLPENLTDLADMVKETGADLGIAVDPDVDRLALVCEDGKMFGEEYTLVAVADYILSHSSGNTVSNMSSSKALKEITQRHGGSYSSAAVGEVNVVEKMKATSAIIGGEGNGGIIYPELHYGRDALVGVALILSQLVGSGKKMSELRSQYPNYHISKNKIQLKAKTNPDEIIMAMARRYEKLRPDLRDGIKIDFPDSWVHLRKSNTEPIIRIYAEASNVEKSDLLAQKIIDEIKDLI